ncbi:MAG: uroporphyrinogen decarboxylase [Oscillospiraceae bacterium]|jgi:hypothetical protein|nr:uroporphyrinogen decarboxylase [Oscillospiraceae bacterium]
MLTKRQNLLETINGGKPDRFVNQYEPFSIIMATPFKNPQPSLGDVNIVDAWGVTKSWLPNTPGPFPVHDEAHILLKDVTKWRDVLRKPNLIFSDAEWEPFVKAAEAIDRKEQFATMFYAPGVFEQCHYFMEISRCCENLALEPEAMLEVIDLITEYEIEYAEQVCKYLKPDALFHHDDWGTQKSTFISPAMFEEFFVPAYKKIYAYYKSHGVELVIHHSDSYAATLVPFMIDVGIDIWQGVMKSNNLPELVRKYGGKISFMGGIDSAAVDFPGWTREVVAAEVKRVCEENGKLYFIPNASQGLPMSNFPGVYEALSEEIDKMSALMF